MRRMIETNDDAQVHVSIDEVDLETPHELLDDEKETRKKQFLVFRRSHVYAVLLPLAFVAGLGAGFLFWGRDVPNAPPTGEQQANVQRFNVPVDDDPIYGPDDAPITIIEFSDYECPYCRRFHIEVFPLLLANYGEQIRFVFRDFPLSSMHVNAISAAQAANCAGEQDKYWEYQDVMFSWAYGLGETAYLQYAQDIDLDESEFTECLESGRYEEEIMADYQFAAQLGIRSTPTFFVNGIPLVGAQPFDVFQDLIDKELAGEIP